MRVSLATLRSLLIYQHTREKRRYRLDGQNGLYALFCLTRWNTAGRGPAIVGIAGRAVKVGGAHPTWLIGFHGPYCGYFNWEGFSDELAQCGFQSDPGRRFDRIFPDEIWS